MAQRHAAESSGTSADAESSGGGVALRSLRGGGAALRGGGVALRGGGVDSNGNVAGSVSSGSVAGTIGNGGGGDGVGDMSDMSEAGEATMKRTRTPALSPAAEYTMPNVYSTSHYYDSPPKKLLR